MIDFSYMLTDCKDSVLVNCPDFYWAASEGMISVSDFAEAEHHCMSIKNITENIKNLLIDDAEMDQQDALELAVNIVANSTQIGLAQFVLNYCDV